MHCPKCHSENSQTNKFCHKCGDKLLLTCPKCHSEVASDDLFCGKCGHKIKTATVLIFHYLIGNFHLLIALCGTVNLLFVILFVEYLMAMKKGVVLQ